MINERNEKSRELREMTNEEWKEEWKEERKGERKDEIRKIEIVRFFWVYLVI